MSLILISQAQQRSDKHSNTANLSSGSNQTVTAPDSFSSLSNYTSSEPLLLLLSGIVIFLGATTLKRAARRKRSDLL
jgi:hypothetical protein